MTPTYKHDDLNAIAKKLIDAGASLSPAVEILRWRNGYTYENFKITGWDDWPTVITLWRAQHGVRQLLEQCQKHDHFDFGEYFQGKTKDIEFMVTEKAVQASSELLPFYHSYALRRATIRLQSHRKVLFAGHQRQDGEFLPALPKEMRLESVH